MRHGNERLILFGSLEPLATEHVRGLGSLRLRSSARPRGGDRARSSDEDAYNALVRALRARVPSSPEGRRPRIVEESHLLFCLRDGCGSAHNLGITVTVRSYRGICLVLVLVFAATLPAGRAGAQAPDPSPVPSPDPAPQPAPPAPPPAAPPTVAPPPPAQSTPPAPAPASTPPPPRIAEAKRPTPRRKVGAARSRAAPRPKSRPAQKSRVAQRPLGGGTEPDNARGPAQAASSSPAAAGPVSAAESINWLLVLFAAALIGLLVCFLFVVNPSDPWD